MRHLIDLVRLAPKNDFVTALFEDAEAILREAVNYDDIFSSLRKSVQKIDAPEIREALIREIDSFAKDQISWAKQNLRKNERIVWFLRLAKVGAPKIVSSRAIAALGKNGWSPKDNISKEDQNTIGEFLVSEIDAYNKKTKGTHINAEMVSERSLESLGDKLHHFLGSDIAAIDKIIFEWQTPSELIDQFELEEQKWKEQRKGLIPFNPKDGEKIITFPDGMMWVMLPRGYCRVEGNAMGHCGNVGADEEDRILSLRRVVEKLGEKFYEPFLTFILDGNGKLGEMKGRGNDKPAKKYHPYIIALLKDDVVQGIKGGGYLPENNFSMADLEDSQIEELVAVKPSLASYRIRYLKDGLTKDIHDKVLDLINPKRTKTGARFSEDGAYIICASYRDMDEAVAMIGSKESAKYIGYLTGDKELDDFIDLDDEYSRAQKFFEHFSWAEEEAVRRYVQAKFPEDDLAEKDGYDIFRFIKDNDPDLYTAMSDSMLLGLQDGILKDLREYFSDACIETAKENGMEVRFGPLEQPHATVDFVMPTADALGLIDKDPEEASEFEQVVDSLYIKIASPDRRGFGMYQRKPAMENFYDLYPEIEENLKQVKPSDRKMVAWPG